MTTIIRQARWPHCYAAILLLVTAFGAGAAGSQEMVSDPLDGLPALPLPVGQIVDRNDPRAAKPRLAAQVAAPIAPDELRSYALVLRLSEAQRRFVRDGYVAYREKVDALYVKYNGPVASLAYEVADTRTHPYDREYLRLFTELRETEERFETELLVFDAAFLNEIQAVLADPQLERFERVTLRRQRKRCQPYNIMLSRARIDMVDLIEQFVRDPDALNDVEALLLEYERLITPPYLRIDDIQRRNELKATRVDVATNYAEDETTWLPINSPERSARAQALWPERVALVGEAFPHQERLAAINEEFLPRVVELLPVAQAEALQAEVLRRVFPMIHPDQSNPMALLLRMTEAEGLDDDLRALLQQEVATYQERYAAITRKMEDHCDAHNREIASTLAGSASYQQELRAQQVERWELGERTVDRILSMLPAELQAAFNSEVQRFKSHLERFRTLGANRPGGIPTGK